MFEEAVASVHLESTGTFRTLLLGVTPEIAELDWPPETELVAADLEPGMLSTVWPGNALRRSAICADWLALPFAGGTFDLVVGDGCLVLLDYPESYQQLAASIRRCLAPYGRFLLRIFCRPHKTETLADISNALRKHEIASFDAFKWRLAMAVQGDQTVQGVALSAVWSAWNALVPDVETFSLDQGWPLHKVLVIDTYRDNPTRYCFPTLDEVRVVFDPVFKEVWHKTGQYELAGRCPHVLFQPARD